MNEPIEISRTKQELLSEARDYTTKLYGEPFERFGFLCGFVESLYPDASEKGKQ